MGLGPEPRDAPGRVMKRWARRISAISLRMSSYFPYLAEFSIR